MNFYIKWIPALILFCCLGAMLSKKANDHTYTLLDYTFYYFITISTCTVWLYVAKYSKSMILDSVLYDCIMSITYATAFVVMGLAQGFTLINYIGLAITLAGLVMIKL